MPVSALVLTLSDDAVERRVAVDALEQDPRIDLGPLQKLHLPVVLTTDTLGDGIGAVKEHLPDVEGIEFVRVVRVDFDDADAAAESQGGWSQVKDRG